MLLAWGNVGCKTSSEQGAVASSSVGPPASAAPARSADPALGCTPYRTVVSWPPDWLLKRIRDPECSAYWLWRHKLRDKPDARVEVCPPAMPGWVPEDSNSDMDRVANVRAKLVWRDRDVQLRLQRQLDATWFGRAEATYWPEHGAAQIAHLQFDSLATKDLATLLSWLLAADLVPAPEIRDRKRLYGAFLDQCRRERSIPTHEIEKLTEEEIVARLEGLSVNGPAGAPRAGGGAQRATLWRTSAG
jgi:hypothetical protein